MRHPTPLADQYDWWRRALSGEQMPIHESDPQPGYYKARAWSRGPYIPAKIWLVSELDEHGELANDEILKAEVGEKEWDALEAWTWLAQRPITLMEHQTLRKALPLVKGMKAQAPTYCHV
ncbi:MAG: hypothetical protein DHS20C08_04320 [Rhodomicrobium sp.]|nr:MAG: hypothetical protein DHS20C08_04320 [Rhodomicrobium sp.]